MDTKANDALFENIHDELEKEDKSHGCAEQSETNLRWGQIKSAWRLMARLFLWQWNQSLLRSTILASSINCGLTFKDFEITNSKGSNPPQRPANWYRTYLEKQSRTSKDESGMDDELSRQQRNSEKQLATEQDSLRCLKTEENTFTTSIGAARSSM